MNKTLHLIASFCFLLLAGTLTAQGVAKYTVLADFEDGFPSNVTALDLDGRTPHGSAPQVKSWAVSTFDGENFFAFATSWFTTVANADDWMIFQDVELDGDAEIIGLEFLAQSLDPGFLETLEILVDTSNTVEPDSFQLVHRIDRVAGGELTEYIVDLSEYAGQEIAIAFRHVSRDKYVLLVDDIALIETSATTAADITGLNNSPYVVAEEGKTVSYSQKVKNIGTEDITSITYRVVNGDDEEIIEREGIRIPSFQSRNLSINIPTSILSAPGASLEIEVIAINGEDIDGPVVHQDYSVIAGDAAFEKLALSEMFTASSCPPCKPGNEMFMDIVDNKIDQEVHFIKYQQDFPNNGDPYTTPELVERRTRYGINAIPELRVDGTVYSVNPNSMNLTTFRNALKKPGFVAFDELDYEVDEESQAVTFTGTYTVLSKVLENTKLMAVVSEDTTYKNKTINGQTYFLAVVKKFLTGIDGVDIDADTPLNEPQSFEFSYTFIGDYRLPINGLIGNTINEEIEHSVEDFGALSVSIWAENSDHQFILNSAKATSVRTSAKSANKFVNEMKVYPQPAENWTQVDLNLEKAIDAEIHLVNMNGQRIKMIDSGSYQIGLNTIQVDLSDVPAGRYVIELKGNNLYHGVPLIVTH